MAVIFCISVVTLPLSLSLSLSLSTHTPGRTRAQLRALRTLRAGRPLRLPGLRAPLHQVEGARSQAVPWGTAEAQVRARSNWSRRGRSWAAVRSAGMRGSNPATRLLRPGDARKVTTRGPSQMRRAGWGRLTRTSAGGRPREARRGPMHGPRMGRGQTSRTGTSWGYGRSGSRGTYVGCWA